ncbi:PREDICTED: RING finger protein 44-like isoform X2 [Polistes dominula]|uniref:RING finger protein 44-like isoform X2 n=1 Tax=Polistes dominula TaxID=743375 RepID=A0ABM1I5X7_POLDO|nr:PREDICTED: RING finger protein 44-like isoform X2 [Polistes dominula]
MEHKKNLMDMEILEVLMVQLLKGFPIISPPWNNHQTISFSSEQQNRHRKRSKRLQNENTVCTICLQEISSQRKVLPCNHSFHEKCINTWRSEGPMGSRNTCPICRQIHVNI